MDSPSNFQLPENLDELTADELADVRAQIRAEFEQVRDDDSIPVRDKAARLTELRDANAAVSAVEADLAQVEQQISELDAEISADDEDPAEESVDDDAEAVDDDPPEAVDDTEAVDEVVAEDDAPTSDTPETPEASDDDAPTADVVELPQSEDDPDDTEQESTAVAASSSPTPAPAAQSSGSPSTTDINAYRSNVEVSEATTDRPFGGSYEIVAAANLDSFDTGQSLSGIEEIAEAFKDRTKGFPSGPSARSERIQAGVAKIIKHFPEELKVPKGADLEPYAKIAADERRLPEGSLTAAGGWCAPSEVWYDITSADETTAGILSLPSVQVSRGGIKHTLGPDFRAIVQASGFFHFTEADAIAGNYDNGTSGNKPCMTVECPPFVDDRLDVDGLCITSDILQDTGYPELLPRFISGALTWHAHKMNALRIKHLVDNSTPASFATISGPTVSLLSALELAVWHLRYSRFRDPNASMEIVLPYWATGPLRLDLSNRLGVELLSVTDEQLVSYMRLRGVNPQFVYDWQDHLSSIAVTGAGGAALDTATGFGSDTMPSAWPENLDVLMYPAGTWVQGENDVISVEAVYDSTNLPQNQFMALFTEEAWMVMQRDWDSYLLTVDLGADYGDTNAGDADPAS